MRPVALAGASGGIAGALLNLVRETAWDSRSPFPLPDLCPQPVIEPLEIGGICWDLKSIIVGVLIGLFLGPVVECISLARQVVVWYLRRQLTQLTRRKAWRYLDEQQ